MAMWHGGGWISCGMIWRGANKMALEGNHGVNMVYSDACFSYFQYDAEMASVVWRCVGNVTEDIPPWLSTRLRHHN
jgi:hypothetical protein